MGVRRLFSRGGQNFPGGGAKTYYLPKNAPKHTIFFQKSRKTFYFGWPRGGGARAPSCPPLRTPMWTGTPKIGLLITNVHIR